MYFWYQDTGGEDVWREALSDHRSKIIQERKPAFVTVLDAHSSPDPEWGRDEYAKMKYSGPLYFDWDAESLDDTIGAPRVLAACGAYLQARDQRIASEREELITSEMTRRWFPAKTREQALKRLRQGVWSEYEMIGHTGCFSAGRVEELQDLATAAGTGTVAVCGRGASLILRWLPPANTPAA